jgi:hypothetical protein
MANEAEAPLPPLVDDDIINDLKEHTRKLRILAKNVKTHLEHNLSIPAEEPVRGGLQEFGTRMLEGKFLL